MGIRELLDAVEEHGAFPFKGEKAYIRHISPAQAEQEILARVPTVEQIYDIISLSCTSQIYLLKFSAEEIQRAIDDMKELAQAIHDDIIKRLGG